MPTAPFRRLAHVAEDAKTLGVGDGGNEAEWGVERVEWGESNMSESLYHLISKTTSKGIRLG